MVFDNVEGGGSLKIEVNVLLEEGMHYIEMYGVVYNDPPSNTPMYWTFSVGIGATTSDTLELTHSNLDLW